MTKRIAIIGAGVMGETLLGSVLGAGHPAGHVVVAEDREDQAAYISQQYGVLIRANHDAVHNADIVFLAVKPHDIADVLDEIAVQLPPSAVVVSVAAGIRIIQLEAALAENTAVIRVMPNTPATVNAGMFAMSPGASCGPEQISDVHRLLASAGEVEIVDESVQDAVTGVSGSGPAYMFYLAEAMIDGGNAAGLPADTARRLTVQTLLGAAKLLAGSELSASQLRRRVTSPGGTTAAAIEVLDEHRMHETIVEAVKAAAARSTELSG